MTVVGGAGAPIAVHSYEDVTAEIRRSQAIAAIGAGLQAFGDGLNASNSAYSTTTTTGTYRQTSPTFNQGSFSAVSTTYDPAQAAIAQAEINRQSQERIAAIAQAGMNRMERAKQILRRTTLNPGDTYQALIVVDQPASAPDEIELRVSILGDNHTARFLISEIE